MANIKLSFLGSEKSETEEHKLECFYNAHNEIYINIEMVDGEYGFICLDKSTAIKLSKTLKTEINKIESEDINV